MKWSDKGRVKGKEGEIREDSRSSTLRLRFAGVDFFYFYFFATRRKRIMGVTLQEHGSASFPSSSSPPVHTSRAAASLTLKPGESERKSAWPRSPPLILQVQLKANR